jgi:hypothetical protein
MCIAPRGRIPQAEPTGGGEGDNPPLIQIKINFQKKIKKLF